MCAVSPSRPVDLVGCTKALAGTARACCADGPQMERMCAYHLHPVWALDTTRKEGWFQKRRKDKRLSQSPALEASEALVTTGMHFSTLRERRLQQPPSFQLPNSDFMLERGPGRPSLGRERRARALEGLTPAPKAWPPETQGASVPSPCS